MRVSAISKMRPERVIRKTAAWIIGPSVLQPGTHGCKIDSMKLTLAAVAMAAIVAAAPAPPDTSTKGLTKAAAAYVAEYQKQMLYVLADEEYIQRTYDQAGNVVRERLMNGDL